MGSSLSLEGNLSKPGTLTGTEATPPSGHGASRIKFPGAWAGVRAPTRGEMKELERPAPDQRRIPKLSVALRLCRSPR